MLLGVAVLLMFASGAPPADVGRDPEVAAVVQQLASYEYGADTAALASVDRLIRTSTPASPLRQQLERELVGLLSSETATLAAKDAACRYLSSIGTSQAVPALARLLNFAQTAQVASYALARIPGDRASVALLEALRTHRDPRVLVSLVNALAARREERAVGHLAHLAAGSQPELAAAAVTALAEIGTPRACRAVERLRPLQNTSGVDIRSDALLACAERHAAGGRMALAEATYRRLFDEGNSPPVRAAALTGLARVAGERTLPLLKQSLKDEHMEVRQAAVRALASRPGAGWSSVLLEAFSRLEPALQLEAMTALIDSGDRAVAPLLVAAARNGIMDLRLTAIEGLGKLGDAGSVPLLAQLAASQPEPVASAARLALSRLASDGVDQAIVSAIPGSTAAVKRELIRAAGERGSGLSAPVLVEAARDPDPQIRREALRALAVVAQPEHLAMLAKLVAAPVSLSDLREAQRTLATALARFPAVDPAGVLEAYPLARDPDARAAMLAVMAQSGRSEFLGLLLKELRSMDPQVRRGAVLALGQWPTADPMPELLEVARKDSSPSLRTLALRSYLRLAGLPSGRTADETARLLAEAYSLASQAEEKRSILALLASHPSPSGLALCEKAAVDPEVAAEARAAAEKIRASLFASQ